MQSFNLEGIKFFFDILKNPRLAIPHYHVPDIRRISAGRLKEVGIKGVIFDKETTLTLPYSLSLVPYLLESVSEFSHYFPKKLAILSNSAGTLDDPDYKKAKRIEEHLVIPVIRHNEKKPNGIESIQEFFDCPASELAIIGDRSFTDVAYGNRYEMLTIKVDPFTSKGDNLMVRRVVRPLENHLVNKWIARGYTAPKHKYQSPTILTGSTH